MGDTQSPETVESILGPRPETVEGILGPKPTFMQSSFSGHPFEATGAIDDYISHTGIGRILDAFGQGAKNGWGGEGLWSPTAEEAMRKAGIFNDTDPAQRSLVKSANEALIRPVAAALDATYRAGAAGFGAYQAGVRQIGEEIGQPELGRDIAALPEAFPTGFHDLGAPRPPAESPAVPLPAAATSGAPGMLPRDFAVARDFNVIGPGGEVAWKGTADAPVANENLIRENVTEAKAAAPEVGEAQAPMPASPPTVDSVAREMAPHVFAEYDPLTRQRDLIRSHLADMAEQNRADHEASAPHAAEIADLEDRLQDTTPRLAKKYEARLEPLRAARDAWLEEHPVADSEDMARMRQLLLETDYRMRDLAPEVTAAYAEAAQRVPQTQAEEAPAAVPAAAPAEPAEVPKVAAEAAPAAVPEAPPAAVPTQAELPLAKPPIVPVASIANDVFTKLVAAGREPEVAQADAAVTEAYYRTRAERNGGRLGTAEELYSREGPEIRAGKGTPVRESEMAKGKEYAQAAINKQVQTPEFKEWFGESKVTDDSGMPRVVYHGTISDIEHFDVSRLGERTGAWSATHGFFFSSDPDVASSYAVGYNPYRHGYLRFINKLTGGLYEKLNEAILEKTGFGRQVEHGENIVPVFLSIENPLKFDFKGQDIRETSFYATLVKAKEGAHDGVLFHNTVDPGFGEGGDVPSDVWVAFRPEQIKSAIGNRGTFDRSSSRILDQLRRAKIRLDPGRAIITMLKDQDASSFMHESGHLYLNDLLTDAGHPQAPADVRGDAATVRQWLGAEGEPTTRQHEKFARGFERYLMEGIAPTRALASVFEKFKNWLTDIYKSVAGLKVDITPAVRDVFDRLLSTNVDRSVVAGEAPEAAAPEVPKAAPKRYTPFETVPKEPTRLTAFLRKMGGLRDDGGDIAHIIGGSKGLPGLISTTGQTLDDAALRAWEHGYINEGQERPTINDLLKAIEEDQKGQPQYSVHDRGRAEDFHAAQARNAEVERLSQVHGIDPRGLTREQFYARVTEKIGKEAAGAEAARLAEQASAEGYDLSLDLHDIEEQSGGEPGSIGEPRTLEDLENEQQQADAAADREHGAYGDAAPGPAGGPEAAGEVGAGQGGGVAGTAEGGRRAGTEPAAGPQQRFEPTSDSLIDKAGNIRVELLNTPEDINTLLRQMADEHGDYLGERRGVFGDAAVLDMAQMLNATGAEMNMRQLRKMFIEDGIPVEVRAKALRLAIRDQGAALREAMAKAKQSQAPADVFAAVMEADKLNMIQGTLSAVTASAGRTLRAFRDLKNDMATAGNLDAIMRHETGRTLFQQMEQIELALKMENPAQLAKFTRDMAKPGAWDYIVEWFIHALISNPVTHVTYAVGNELLTLWKMGPETAGAAAIGSIREALGKPEPKAPVEHEAPPETTPAAQGLLNAPRTDEPIPAPAHEAPWRSGDRVYWGEVGAGLYGFMRGSKQGLEAARKALLTGDPVKLPGEADVSMALQQRQKGVIPNFRPNIPGIGEVPVPLGEVIRAPGRMVSAIHAVARFQNYSMAISQMAYRTAMNEGLLGNDFAARVATLEMSPPEAMMAAARDEATKTALMGRGGEFSKAVVQLANSRLMGTKIPKLIIPFAQISANIMTEGLLQRTALGIADPAIRNTLLGKDGVARDTQIARIAVGSTLAGTALTYAAAGNLTGAEPADPKERAIWRAEGKQAYSINVGGTWYSYARLGVMAKPVGLAADLWQVGEAMTEKDVGSIAMMIATSFSRLVLDESSMRGVSDALNAAEDPQRSGLRWAKSFATSFIPFSMAVGQVAREVDPWDRQARTMLDAFKAKIPGLSETLPQRIDIWGMPIPARTSLGGVGLTSIYTTRETHDPVTQTLAGLQERTGHGWPAMPENRIRGVVLNDEQYEYYARTAGMLAHQWLLPMVTTPGFSAQPSGQQVKLTQDIIEKARKMAQTQVMMRSYGGANDIITQANQAKVKQLTAP